VFLERARLTPRARSRPRVYRTLKPIRLGATALHWRADARAGPGPNCPITLRMLQDVPWRSSNSGWTSPRSVASAAGSCGDGITR
jgi:hypothetical protein